MNYYSHHNSSMAINSKLPDRKAAPKLQADELDGTNPYGDSIPSRIQCHVPLEVKTSSTTGAGRAIFAKKSVKIGDVVFRISNPLVAVPDFEDGLRICDNCFAYEEHGGVMTIPTARKRFTTCGECKTVLYCSLVCQEASWKHHHKHECEFRKVFIEAPALRTRISGLTQRLAFMRASGKISELEWKEVRTLFRGKITEDLGDREQAVEECMDSKARVFADAARDTGKRQVGEDEVRQIGFAIANYAWTAHNPIFGIDAGCTLACQLPAQIATGWFFDPFPALMNHCCQPNASYFCNGKEMVAKAVEDIAAGEEITYSYNYEPVCDYESRRRLLKDGFGFDCECRLCQKGDLGPKGDLRERLMRFIGDGAVNAEIEDLDVIEELIEDMEAAGFYLESGHMYELQKCAAHLYITTKAFRRFLASYLTMFTIAFNLQTPTAPYRFFGTRWALAIMNPFLQATQPGAEYWRAALLESAKTMSLRCVFDDMWLQLLEVHVGDLARFYGSDTPVVEVARDSLRAKRRKNNATGSVGIKRTGDHSLEQAIDEMGDGLIGNVNKLLEWAGLPLRSREEVLGK